PLFGGRCPEGTDEGRFPPVAAEGPSGDVAIAHAMMPRMSFAFVDAALDRAEHLRLDDARLDALWPDARLLRLDADGRALAASDDAFLPITGADHGARDPDAVLLGLDGDGHAWFALADTSAADASPRIDLRSAAAHWPVREATAFAQ